ncbi:MAG: general secretion pathway protein GspB [Desulfobacterales bacterium]
MILWILVTVMYNGHHQQRNSPTKKPAMAQPDMRAAVTPSAGPDSATIRNSPSSIQKSGQSQNPAERVGKKNSVNPTEKVQTRPQTVIAGKQPTTKVNTNSAIGLPESIRGSNRNIRQEPVPIQDDEKLRHTTGEPVQSPPDETRSVTNRMGEEPRQIPVYQEGDLKLMAIAWAENPDGRIAVINGVICREGGSITGVQIVQIDKEEVIVQKEGRDYKIPFNLR